MEKKERRFMRALGINEIMFWFFLGVLIGCISLIMVIMVAALGVVV